MPGRERVISVVREWVNKADNDLRNATHTLTLRRKCPTDTVCFHAQQCVEKYFKALLTLEGIESPKTHSLDVLIASLPPPVRPMLTADEQDRLTEYATVTRYPGDYDPIPRAEAEQAVRIAERVRREIRSNLPKDAWMP